MLAHFARMRQFTHMEGHYFLKYFSLQLIIQTPNYYLWFIFLLFLLLSKLVTVRNPEEVKKKIPTNISPGS